MRDCLRFFEGLIKGKGFRYLLEVVEAIEQDSEKLFKLSMAFKDVARREGKTTKGIESSIWYFVQGNFLGYKNRANLRRFFGQGYKPPKYGSFLIDLIVKILGQ